MAIINEFFITIGLRFATNVLKKPFQLSRFITREIFDYLSCINKKPTKK